MIQVTISDLNGNQLAGARFSTQQEVDAFLATNWPPSDQYAVQQSDITQQLADEQAKADARAYLDATDYMIIRSVDSGVPVSQDVKDKRQQARLTINPQGK